MQLPVVTTPQHHGISDDVRRHEVPHRQESNEKKQQTDLNPAPCLRTLRRYWNFRHGKTSLSRFDLYSIRTSLLAKFANIVRILAGRVLGVHYLQNKQICLFGDCPPGDAADKP
jgi:S-adenosylmethionine:diacylglycerol 3-amino-3-carboxypropyl transferase